MRLQPVKDLKLTRVIEPAEEKAYIEVPFVMPEGIERIKVEYWIAEQGGEQHVVDLGIRDMKRVRGWSGGARPGFEIGPETATPGYLAGGLAAGEWAVLLGAYRIGPSGCRVELAVELTPETGRWLKGELHAHTDHSDGAYSLSAAVELAELGGLDFLALTDHNTVSQNLTRPRGDGGCGRKGEGGRGDGIGSRGDDADGSEHDGDEDIGRGADGGEDGADGGDGRNGLVLIPAMELTTNYGHCNFYGVDEPVTDFRAESPEQVRLLMQQAKERGAYVSLNHPHCRSCGWLWGFDAAYDWVELWNGPWREDNQATLDWWQEQLASGRRLTAIGGSDFHRDHPFIRHGMPCTWVYAESRSARGILEAIGQGHASLSYAPDAPRLELDAGAYMMGDTIPRETVFPQQMNVQIKVHGCLNEGDKLRLLTDRGLEAEWPVEATYPLATHELVAHGLVTYPLAAHELATTDPLAESGISPKTVGFPEEAGLRSDPPCYLWQTELKERLFYRVELWRRFAETDTLLLAAATNPLYIR
ncbi:MAG: phosphoesterase [Paenibacillaceae bacterium]|jgi:hypothetical protein|nr:phosphoesterase [Paenibacillaceae bacterium]